jgi:hypothetical protein
MINSADRHRIGQARLLRRQGKTYEEIRTVVGSVTEDDLRHWMKGIARPPETFRAKAKDELREKCRQLRLAELTYDDIAELTGASKGSLSLWLRDLPRTFPGSKEQRQARLESTCAKNREDRAVRRAAKISSAASAVGPLGDRELFFVGLALYWAEGTKSKPWAIRDRVTFVNSDPSVILVFMRWLALIGVSLDRCRFRVAIHESADVPGAEKYWAELIGFDVETIYRSTLKRHQPKTTRYNTGESYRGCLVINIAKSAELYRSVEGWWRGVASGVERVANPMETLG